MRPRHKILAVTLVIVLLASCTASYFIGKASFTGSLESLPWYAGAPTEHSYIVTTNTTNFFCFNGTTGRLELTTTNSSAAIMNALNNVTTEGGSVFVKSGVYNATVVLKNSTRLVLDKGAAGVTVSIDTGATCIFEDYNAGISWWYSAGLLVMQHNNLNGLIIGTYSSFAQYYSAGLNRTDAVVNPIAPYSYVIDKSGSTYRMKNGTTGQIDYSSTNASQIFNSASDNLATTGGYIYIKNGLYTLTNEWVITPPSAYWELNIIGEDASQTTVIGSASMTNKALINCTATSFYPSGIYWRRYINLENLNFQTTGVENYAIHLPNVSTHIKNVWVNGALSTGSGGDYNQIQVELGGSAPPAYPSSINGLHIDSSVSTANVSALQLKTWFEGLEIEALTLQCYANATYLWRLYGTSTHISKFNVFIQASTQVTSGIVYALGTSGLERHTFSSVFVATPKAGSTEPIGGNYFVKVASDYTGVFQVEEIYLNMTTFAGICYDAKTSTSTVFEGYGFEERGVNATAADGGQQAISGLYGIPTYVFLTSGNSTNNVICSAYGLASGHFHYHFNATSGQTVYWYAVYDP